MTGDVAGPSRRDQAYCAAMVLWWLAHAIGIALMVRRPAP